MSLNLILTMICASLILVIITTHFLKKGRIPEKYALLWYLFAPFVGLHAHGLDDNIITSTVITCAIVVSFIIFNVS